MTKIRLSFSLFAFASLALACSSSAGSNAAAGGSGASGGSAAAAGSGGQGNSSGASSGGSGGNSGSAAGGSSGNTSGGSAGAGGAGPTCITPTTAQNCVPPSGTTLPICKLSLTGCMDAQAPTKFVSKAIPYEVNSPLWSDNAAKSRAFVLPAGGKIHVKNCMPDAGAAALAECMSPMSVPNGPADTGKWVLPVGTVMIKNFIFDGKFVETRLLMRVDAATSTLLQNTYGFQLGTDWVGYNYAWNEAQTEALIVPNARTEVSFNTGTRKVPWNYPNFLDCTGCHSPAVGTIGPETDQMNRMVTPAGGGAMVNQIDAFKTMGLFDDTAPVIPYAAPMVEPYTNAALGLNDPTPSGTAAAVRDLQARSYLAANCGFCHRPDVNDQGFDLRFSLALKDTNICNLMEQNGIPPMPQTQYADLAPGNHAASAMWIRMNIAIPDNPGTQDYGRMPSVASNIVDPQATALIGSWIDAMTSCP
ncbi:MAG TPA: hypothetical protein VNW92_18665 [Polyangiaceae bacterium]|nr:hypothetical protein [Polyangiaceae bacterium]